MSKILKINCIFVFMLVIGNLVPDSATAATKKLPSYQVLENWKKNSEINNLNILGNAELSLNLRINGIYRFTFNNLIKGKSVTLAVVSPAGRTKIIQQSKPDTKGVFNSKLFKFNSSGKFTFNLIQSGISTRQISIMIL